MKYRVRVGQRGYEVAVDEDQGGYRMDLDGQPHTLEVLPYLGNTHVRVQVDGVRHVVTIRREAEDLLVGVAEDRYRVQVERVLPIPRTRPAGASTRLLEVRAPSPGSSSRPTQSPAPRLSRAAPW